MGFGKNGWIGEKLIAMLREQGKTVVLAQTRLENREALFAELDEVNTRAGRSRRHGPPQH